MRIRALPLAILVGCVGVSGAAVADYRGELFLGVGDGVAGSNHKAGTRFGATLGGAAIWTRSPRLSLEAAADLRPSIPDDVWYSGDSSYPDNMKIVRLRALAAIRYRLLGEGDAILYARAAAGLELRFSYYDTWHDTGPYEEGAWEPSLGPAIEPGVGFRLGGRGYLGGRVSLPIAYHRHEAIDVYTDQVHLTVDLDVTIHFGWTFH